MSVFLSTVSSVESSNSLHIVKFTLGSETLCMMSLELDESIKKSRLVKLSVKPTHVVLSKSLSGDISFENSLKGSIVSIDSGKLLCSVKVALEDTILESIVTKESQEKMNLKIGDKVTALIQASELYIVEVLDV
jgi:molybdopterin-binding protein